MASGKAITLSSPSDTSISFLLQDFSGNAILSRVYGSIIRHSKNKETLLEYRSILGQELHLIKHFTLGPTIVHSMEIKYLINILFMNISMYSTNVYWSTYICHVSTLLGYTKNKNITALMELTVYWRKRGKSHGGLTGLVSLVSSSPLLDLRYIHSESSYALHDYNCSEVGGSWILDDPILLLIC